MARLLRDAVVKLPRDDAQRYFNSWGADLKARMLLLDLVESVYIGPGQRYRLKDRLWFDQDGRCAFCGRDCLYYAYPNGVTYPPNAFTLEHVIPKRRGGTDDFRNLVGACSACNKFRDLAHRAEEFYTMACGGIMETGDPWKDRVRKTKDLDVIGSTNFPEISDKGVGTP